MDNIDKNIEFLKIKINHYKKLKSKKSKRKLNAYSRELLNHNRLKDCYW